VPDTLGSRPVPAPSLEPPPSRSASPVARRGRRCCACCWWPYGGGDGCDERRPKAAALALVVSLPAMLCPYSCCSGSAERPRGVSVRRPRPLLPPACCGGAELLLRLPPPPNAGLLGASDGA
jgi:hypothetical protein